MEAWIRPRWERAGKSGSATWRASVRFIVHRARGRSLSCRAQRPRRTDEFAQDFDGSAGGINHWADFDDARVSRGSLNIRRAELKLLAFPNLPQKNLRKRKADAERRFRSDPEEPVSSPTF